eukprot:9853384-Lingulodinium_polyedra.AAC.1
MSRRTAAGGSHCFTWTQRRERPPEVGVATEPQGSTHLQGRRTAEGQEGLLANGTQTVALSTADGVAARVFRQGGGNAPLRCGCRAELRR